MSIIVYGMLFMGVLALVFLVKMTLEGDLSLVENPETLLVLPLLGGAFYQLFSAKNKKQSLGEFHFKEEGMRLGLVSYLWSNLILSEYLDSRGILSLYTLNDRAGSLWILSAFEDELYLALREAPTELKTYTKCERFSLGRNSMSYKILAKAQDHYLIYNLATGEHTVGKVESQEEQNFSPKVYVSDPKVKELVRS